MKKLKVIGSLFLLMAGFVLATSAASSQQPPKVGVVNFKNCIESSKVGKQEQARFDELKKQLEKTIDTKEKELQDMSGKFSDEYLDTLSPEAEAELKGKFKNLSQELSQLQNQYYNMLNQANYQIVSRLQDSISKAAKKISEAKGLDMAINEEICFFYSSNLDITKEVISEMDTQFEKESKDSDKKSDK
jgi:outer membrane protein